MRRDRALEMTAIDSGGTRMVAVQIADPSQIGEARRLATKLAAAGGLDETATGRVSLIVTELGTNILKHAVRGEMTLRLERTDAGASVEVLAIDAGPGIPDVDRAIRDGYSTAGSSGTGLGAVGRLAATFDVFSARGRGTVAVARISSPGWRPLRAPLQLGVVRVPKAEETECGDDWSLSIRESGSAMLLVADGLGHGIAAAEASSLAARVASERPEESVTETMTAVHAALRSTRGAAVGAVVVDADATAIHFAGIGNISGFIAEPGQVKTLVSHNGIAGHSARRIQEFRYAWPSGALLVLHSDGVSARWTLDDYPGIMTRDPSIIAGVLYRDFTRHRDDAIVVVARAVH